MLGKHCGSALPASVDTSDSFAFVKFVSDSSGNAAGFSLAFEASVEGTVKVFGVLLPWVTAQNSSNQKFTFRLKYLNEASFRVVTNIKTPSLSASMALFP